MATTMTTIEFVESVITAMITDVDFIAWCESEFSRQPSISLCYDEDNPAEFDADPILSEYPLIAIVQCGHTLGQGDANITYSITMKICVHNTGRAKIGTVTRYAGMAQVENFRTEIQNAIFRAGIGHDLSIDGGYDAMSTPPFHECYINLRSAVPASRQRRHPY